jgi:hypothetical protein
MGKTPALDRIATPEKSTDFCFKKEKYTYIKVSHVPM